MTASLKVVYTHQVCQHYKVPFLTRLQCDFGHEIYGLFGQSHWRNSKYRSIPKIDEISEYKLLPTIDAFFSGRKPAMHLFLNPNLYRELKRIAPDVVITGVSNFPNNLMIARYCSNYGIPYVWHGIGSVQKGVSKARRIVDRQIRRFIEEAAGGLAFNTGSKDYYVENYDVNPESILVATNVVDTEKVIRERNQYASKLEKLRAELCLQDARVVLFVGRMDPEKRVEKLIRAFALIHAETESPTMLLLVGDGVEAERCKRLTIKLGIQSSTVFTGQRVKDVNLYYMLGDVFVMPGLGGLAVSHSMAHGLPTITAPADGTERDLIDHGRSGFLLSSLDDSRMIADYVLQLLANPQYSQNMGKLASEAIRDRFGIGHTVATFDEMIRRVTRTQQSCAN